MQKHPTNPGKLTLADLAGYQPKKRAPICHDYRAQGKDYRICGFPPPEFRRHRRRARSWASWATPTPPALPLQDGLPSADWLHLYTEAARLAFADRGQYLGDPDFVQPPGGSWMSLLDPAYLAERARLIQPAGPA